MAALVEVRWSDGGSDTLTTGNLGSPTRPANDLPEDRAADRLRRLRSLIRKESRQILRDPSSILIAFALPLIMLVIYGFGVSLDLQRVRIGLVIERPGPEATALAASFRGSRYFDLRIAADRGTFADDLAAGRLHGIVVVPQDFAGRLHRADGGAPMQVIANGTQPNTASFVQNYVQGVVQVWRQQRAYEEGRDLAPAIAVEPRVWFNPELESRRFLVPASIAIIMTLIGTLLTALVIAREWERGTMEALMATPVGVAEILLGKLVPYFALGLTAMAVCAAVAVFGFGVPLRGSPLALLLTAIVFLVPALGQGLLISAAAKNQFVASQMALMSGFLPAMLLSGFIFEIGSMPWPIRLLTYAVHARYFVSSLQTLFLAGDVWTLLVPNLFAMLAIGAVFVGLSLRLTKKRLA